MRTPIAVLLLVNLVSACTGEHTPTRQTYRLEHSWVRLVPPAGWEHIDYGREHQFRHGRARVTLELMNAYPRPPQVEVILERLGHDERRSIASMRTVIVGAREALVIETWDQLSHAMPMRVALAPCDDRQLVLHTCNGDYKESIEAFDSILASIEIIDPDSLPSSLGTYH